jgi:NAD(P)-dependent dehydrogenase (short-subunit alcohol dehydrogenase family)
LTQGAARRITGVVLPHRGRAPVSNPSPRLAGRFALVTGASRGIGRAVAARFAAEGASVCINHYRDAQAAEASLAAARAASAAAGFGAAKHFAHDADVADEAADEAMVAACLAAWGRLDILVNNAGMQTLTPGDGFVTEDLRKVLSIDLEGPAYCAAVGPGAVATDMNAGWTGDPKARAAVESHIPIATIGRPESDVSRIGMASGTSPRKGTPSRAASCRAPPWAKMSERVPHSGQMK